MSQSTSGTIAERDYIPLSHTAQVLTKPRRVSRVDFAGQLRGIAVDPAIVVTVGVSDHPFELLAENKT